MRGVTTLLEWGKRLEPGDSGMVAKIVEMLNQSNEMLVDMHWTKGNLPTGNRTTIRTGLPPAYWRQINQPAPAVKSRTAQVDEPCGLMEQWSEVDEELLAINEDAQAFRLSEAYPILESMSQEAQRTLLYGGTSSVTPEQFPGLATRYNTTNRTIAQTAQNVIDAGGTGTDNTSIWVICWGDGKVSGIFPKNTMAGIQRKDFGLKTRDGVDENGNPTIMAVYREQFKWRLGLMAQDWRYAVRIANIDVGDLNSGGENAPDIITQLTKAFYRCLLYTSPSPRDS